MAGLLDMHLLAGNAQALTVLTGMAAGRGSRNGRLTQTQRQNMLDTEFGGMNEVLANLYQLTGDPAHLTTAQYFDHAEIFDPLAHDTDALNGYHANTQIPKALGAIREYHATGTTRYRDIADELLAHRGQRRTPTRSAATPTASTSRRRAGSPASCPTTTCECCNTYNMLKLTRQLFRTDPARRRYFDFYEKALYNHLLGAQNPASAHGHHSYYVPLRPGGIKTLQQRLQRLHLLPRHRDGDQHQARRQHLLPLRRARCRSTCSSPSVLTWPGRGITVRQDTSFPESAATRLTITGSGADRPAPARPVLGGRRTVACQRRRRKVPVTPGSYVRVDRNWVSGDVVELSLPMALHRESAPDNRTAQAVEIGPIVLAGAYGTNNLSSLPTLQPSTLRPTAPVAVHRHGEHRAR